MIEIGRAILSREIFEEHFVCDLLKCKGACCVEGESGAPLTPDEAKIIENEYENFREFLPEDHQKEIQKQGFSVIDHDGDLVTPLVNNRQCAYSFFDENGIVKCAIEKAYFEKKTHFRKPISCHLFPIRIAEYENFDALNYQKIDICKPARSCGKSLNVRIYEFLKEPLTRKYGKEWYEQVEAAAGYLDATTP
jgi:hypothetical protein